MNDIVCAVLSIEVCLIHQSRQTIPLRTVSRLDSRPDSASHIYQSNNCEILAPLTLCIAADNNGSPEWSECPLRGPGEEV